MSGIILSQKHGVNPHLTFCPNCHGETPELILTGAARLFQCSCGKKYLGFPKSGQCDCGSHNFTNMGEVPPETRLPAHEVCTNCAHNMAICAEEVRNGGVPWRCQDCGSEGSIKASAPFAQEWRAKCNGQVMGILFKKDQCPVCGDKT